MLGIHLLVLSVNITQSLYQWLVIMHHTIVYKGLSAG